MATIPRENLLFINADEGEESKPPAASITTDNMLLVKRQLPNQSELKYLITSFLATQRPRPSVARADRRTGTAIASREEFHHTFNISSSFFDYYFFLFLLTPGKRLMDFAPTKQTHSNCFPECILFNNSPFDRREKKCNIHTDKCPALFHPGPRSDAGKILVGRVGRRYSCIRARRRHL